MKYPRFEVRKTSTAEIQYYRLWLVLDEAHERHLDSSWDEITLYDMADAIKNAAITTKQEVDK